VGLSETTVKTATVGLTATVSPRLVNELRFNYSSNVLASSTTTSTFGGAVPLTDSVLPQGTTSKTAQLAYYIFSPLMAYGYGGQSENSIGQFNVTDSLSLTRGTHHVKFGFDYRRLNPTSTGTNIAVLGLFMALGSGTGNLLSGLAYQAGVSVGPGYPLELLTRNYSVFAQDSWNVSRRLTVTYGIRWDVNPALKGANAESSPYPFTNVNSPATIGVGTRGGQLYPTSWTNFAPRIGVSYQLRQQPGKETVLRGGFGLFYDSSAGTIGSAIGGFPYGGSAYLNMVPFPLSATQINTLAASVVQDTLPASAIYGADPNLVTPRVRQWNVAVEQALGKSQSLTVSYVGAVGRDLYRKNRYSAPNPMFTGSVYITGNTGTSNYQALQLSFQRRLSRGLQVLANYTWSHSIDNASDDQTYTFSPVAIYSPTADRGNSDFDARHAGNVVLSYQVPAAFKSGVGSALLSGWGTDSIFNFRSALPVSLIGSSGSIQGTRFDSRPNVVPGQPLYLYGSQYPGGMAYNKAAFVSAGTSQQGNLGRNVMRAFGTWQENIAIRRQFRLAEGIGLQFRTEFFNIFNHPSFGPPTNSLTSALFGRATQTLQNSLSNASFGGGLNPIFQNGGPRSIQLALKLLF